MRHEIPAWIRHLEDTDLHFIKRMVLASGSLKQLSQEYEVSYPTIRARLDKIIERVQTHDTHPQDDALEAKIRMLVSERQIEVPLARQLLALHRQTKESPND